MNQVNGITINVFEYPKKLRNTVYHTNIILITQQVHSTIIILAYKHKLTHCHITRILYSNEVIVLINLDG